MGRTGFGWLRIGSSDAFCEHGNEPSTFTKKAGYIFNKLSDYQLFKEYPAPWGE
jgi:hypothetical protein